jgi:hypothetical protein
MLGHHNKTPDMIFYKFLPIPREFKQKYKRFEHIALSYLPVPVCYLDQQELLDLHNSDGSDGAWTGAHRVFFGDRATQNKSFSSA